MMYSTIGILCIICAPVLSVWSDIAKQFLKCMPKILHFVIHAKD